MNAVARIPIIKNPTMFDKIKNHSPKTASVNPAKIEKGERCFIILVLNTLKLNKYTRNYFLNKE